MYIFVLRVFSCLWYNNEMNKFYLIDNNIFYLSSLQSQLRSIDCNVFVNHGDLGEIYPFKEILRHQPEIIIMDLVFPSLDGLSLLHRLQEDHSTNNIPVIVYTNFENKNLEEKSAIKGAHKFFLKEDFNPKYLIDRILKIY